MTVCFVLIGRLFFVNATQVGRVYGETARNICTVYVMLLCNSLLRFTKTSSILDENFAKKFHAKFSNYKLIN